MSSPAWNTFFEVFVFKILIKTTSYIENFNFYTFYQGTFCYDVSSILTFFLSNAYI